METFLPSLVGLDLETADALALQSLLAQFSIYSLDDFCKWDTSSDAMCRRELQLDIASTLKCTEDRAQRLMQAMLTSSGKGTQQQQQLKHKLHI